MLDQFLDINMSLDYIRSNYLVCLGIFWHVAAVILGGLAVWSGFIIAHFVLRRSTPRRGRR